MNDEAHILLIDAHTESNCGYNDLNLVSHPFILHLFAFIVGEFSVIKVTLHLIIAFQYLCQFFTLFTGDAIDDTRFSLETGLKHLNEIIIDVFELLFVTNFIHKIRSVETRLEKGIVFVDVESFNNVILDFNCSSCC